MTIESSYKLKLALLRRERQLEDLVTLLNKPQPKGRFFGPRQCNCLIANCGCRYFVRFRVKPEIVAVKDSNGQFIDLADGIPISENTL